jgi:hypothetical protein
MIECKSEECTSSLSFNNKWMESLLVEVHKNGIFVERICLDLVAN